MNDAGESDAKAHEIAHGREGHDQSAKCDGILVFESELKSHCGEHCS